MPRNIANSEIKSQLLRSLTKVEVLALALKTIDGHIHTSSIGLFFQFNFNRVNNLAFVK